MTTDSAAEPSAAACVATWCALLPRASLASLAYALPSPFGDALLAVDALDEAVAWAEHRPGDAARAVALAQVAAALRRAGGPSPRAARVAIAAYRAAAHDWEGAPLIEVLWHGGLEDGRVLRAAQSAVDGVRRGPWTGATRAAFALALLRAEWEDAAEHFAEARRLWQGALDANDDGTKDQGASAAFAAELSRCHLARGEVDDARALRDEALRRAAASHGIQLAWRATTAAFVAAGDAPALLATEHALPTIALLELAAAGHEGLLEARLEAQLERCTAHAHRASLLCAMARATRDPSRAARLHAEAKAEGDPAQLEAEYLDGLTTPDERRGVEITLAWTAAHLGASDAARDALAAVAARARDELLSAEAGAATDDGATPELARMLPSRWRASPARIAASRAAWSAAAGSPDDVRKRRLDGARLSCAAAVLATEGDAALGRELLSEVEAVLRRLQPEAPVLSGVWFDEELCAAWTAHGRLDDALALLARSRTGDWHAAASARTVVALVRAGRGSDALRELTEALAAARTRAHCVALRPAVLALCGDPSARAAALDAMGRAQDEASAALATWDLPPAASPGTP